MSAKKQLLKFAVRHGIISKKRAAKMIMKSYGKKARKVTRQFLKDFKAGAGL